MLIFGYTALNKVLQWILPLSFSSNVTTRKFLMTHVAQILFLWEKNAPEGTVLFWGLDVSIFLCNTEISIVTIAIKKNRLIRLSSSFSPFPAPYRKGGQQKKKGRNGPGSRNVSPKANQSTSHLGSHRQEPVASLTLSRAWFPVALKTMQQRTKCLQNKDRRMAPNKISRTLQEQTPFLHQPNPPSTLALAWPLNLTSVPVSAPNILPSS